MLITDKKAAEADAKPRWFAQNRWNNTHRLERAAHRAVAKALREGTLTRGKCETCGSLRVVAHHDDYSKPLEVRWFCPGDHQRYHVALRRAAE